jgi:ABC-2 type transport system ATP-binding protein
VVEGSRPAEALPPDDQSDAFGEAAAPPAEPAPAALDVVGLSKQLGSIWAIEDVSLQLPVGLAYGIAGPNGSGKSTLLRVLATLERPTRGSVRVLGLDPLLDPAGVRRLIGYVGRPSGTPALTVLEELEMAARLRGVGAAERRETVPAMLQLVDLHERRHRPVGQLSLGDLRRLALARALVHDPAVLLLDGPLEGLDASARAELRAVLVELPLMGKTLLVTGATVVELAGLCDEVGLLDRGRLVASGPIDQLLGGGEPGRPLRLLLADAASGRAARSVLEGHPQVSGLQSVDERAYLLRLSGDAAAQAVLVGDLVAAGALVVELAPAREEAEAELARAVRSGP